MNIATETARAIRALARTPSISVPAVASLALAITLNTTLFAIVNGLLLRPLVPADDLVRIGRTHEGDAGFRSVAYPDFLGLRGASTLDALAGHQLESIVMTSLAGPEIVSAEIVTPGYFAVTRTRPAAGATLDAADEHDRAAFISHTLWVRAFGADPATVGRAITLGGNPFTIIGIGEPAFTGTFPGVSIDLWLPARSANAALGRPQDRGMPSLMLIGRLKAGATIDTAQAELHTLARQLPVEPGEPARRFAIQRARGIHPAFASIVRTFLGILMAAVGVVLLIACANVMGLLLARVTARRTEIAIRLACGASRWRVIRELLLETLVMAAAGAAAGLAITAAIVRILAAFSPADGPTGAPLVFDLPIDGRVVLFTFALAVLSAAAAGVIPALRATRGDLAPALKGLPGRGGRSHLRSGLLVFQIAVSSLLLAAAALLIGGLHRAASMDLGFDPDRVAVAGFELRPLGYDAERSRLFHDEMLQRVRMVPSVGHAAWADFIPMADPGGWLTLHDQPEAGRRVRIPYGVVSPGYFATVGQPIVRGRDFRAGDRAGAPFVAIVNEAFARVLLGGGDAVGRRMRLAGEEEREFEIVGVIRDARFWVLGGSVEPLALLPASQHPGPSLSLHVQSSLDAASLAAALRRISTAIDPNVPVDVEPMRKRMAFALVPAAVARVVFVIAGSVALLLAMGGLYGLVTFTIEQRRRELGIRAALGATPAALYRLIGTRVLMLGALGIGIGSGAAILASRLLTSMLSGLPASNPAALASVASVLLLTIAAATYAAARRTLTGEPAGALRRT